MTENRKVQVVMLNSDKNQFEGLDVHQAIEKVETLRKISPQIKNKPTLKYNPTSKEVKEYGETLEKYEQELESYKNKKETVDQYNRELYNNLEQHLKTEAGLYNIPKQSQQKVWELAWREGHSSGYSSVYYWLEELIELF